MHMIRKGHMNAPKNHPCQQHSSFTASPFDKQAGSATAFGRTPLSRKTSKDA